MQTNIPGVFAAGDAVTFPLALRNNKKVNVPHWQMAHMHGRCFAEKSLFQILRKFPNPPDNCQQRDWVVVLNILKRVCLVCVVPSSVRILAKLCLTMPHHQHRGAQGQAFPYFPWSLALLREPALILALGHLGAHILMPAWAQVPSWVSHSARLAQECSAEL